MKKLGEIDYSILQQCIHCGMCLPTCPTYMETKEERNSPRGRIALMRAIADRDLQVTKEFGEEMYYCLGCLACTSACPAGVNYGELFEVARAEVESRGVLDNPKRNLIRWFALRFLFTRPRLLRLAGRSLWVWQASGMQRLARAVGVTKLLPNNLRRLEPQTPTMHVRFSHQWIAAVERPSSGPVSRRVAVLTGCVQDLAFPEINRATVDVLLANGCEVHTPPVQPCCGSLHAHNGDIDTAQKLARRQLDLIDPSAFDAIISNAGGCGSHLRHYDRLLENDPEYRERARDWSRKLKDISEYLVEIGFRRPAASQNEERVPLTYHDSCHLFHGQKISSQPREILKAIPGMELRECVEATWCCGSAGIYNITQPETSEWLRERKVGHLRNTNAKIVATANPGCLLQIENGFKQAGDAMEVAHPVVLLARAYRKELARESDRNR